MASTIKQQRLARATIEAITSDKPQKTTKQAILEQAGYSKETRKVFKTKGYNEALIEAMDKAGITDEKVASKIDLLLSNEENINAVDKGISHYIKIKGSYAPLKSEVEHKGSIQHTLENDNGDYMKYLQEKNKQRQIIEGEILD